MLPRSGRDPASRGDAEPSPNMTAPQTTQTRRPRLGIDSHGRLPGNQHPGDVMASKKHYLGAKYRTPDVWLALYRLTPEMRVRGKHRGKGIGEVRDSA